MTRIKIEQVENNIRIICNQRGICDGKLIEDLAKYTMCEIGAAGAEK